MRHVLHPVYIVGAVLLASCADDSSTGLDSDPGAIEPADVVAAYLSAVQQKDLSAFTALLEEPTTTRAEGFRFDVRESDRRFSWLADGSWDYQDELGIAANWFDPAFEVPGGQLLGLELSDLSVLDEQELEDGTIEVTAEVSVVAHLPSEQQHSLTSNLRVVLVSDGNEGYLIRSMTEARSSARGSAGPLLQSLGILKSRYRDRSSFGDQTAWPLPNSIENTIQAHSLALDQRDYDVYLSLLAPQTRFEFCPRADDVIDIPWLTGECWDRAVEADIIGNMFNPDFAETEPAVESIEVAYATIAEFPIRDEFQNVIGARVTLDAVIQVLIGPSTGWVANTRFEIDVVARLSEPGLFEIGRIAEFAQGRVEETSWAMVKALYR